MAVSIPIVNGKVIDFVEQFAVRQVRTVADSFNSEIRPIEPSLIVLFYLNWIGMLGKGRYELV